MTTPSPIAAVPVEILTKMFILASHDDSSQFYDTAHGIPWVISHVCSDWSIISRSTPELWPKIIFTELIFNPQVVQDPDTPSPQSEMLSQMMKMLQETFALHAHGPAELPLPEELKKSPSSYVKYGGPGLHPEQLECLRYLLAKRVGYARPRPLSILINARMHKSIGDGLALKLLETLLPERTTWESIDWSQGYTTKIETLFGKQLESFLKLRSAHFHFYGAGVETSYEMLENFRNAPLLSYCSLVIPPRFDRGNPLPQLPWRQIRRLGLKEFFDNDLGNILKLVKQVEALYICAPYGGKFCISPGFILPHLTTLHLTGVHSDHKTYAWDELFMTLGAPSLQELILPRPRNLHPLLHFARSSGQELRTLICDPPLKDENVEMLPSVLAELSALEHLEVHLAHPILFRDLWYRLHLDPSDTIKQRPGGLKQQTKNIPLGHPILCPKLRVLSISESNNVSSKADDEILDLISSTLQSRWYVKDQDSHARLDYARVLIGDSTQIGKLASAVDSIITLQKLAEDGMDVDVCQRQPEGDIDSFRMSSLVHPNPRPDTLHRPWMDSPAVWSFPGPPCDTEAPGE